MLSREKNELLTRIGPGTPMNALFRRYWLPAMLSSDLDPDGDPKRIRMLGEDYVAFRDTAGRVGVVDNACCHRGISLALGRNEAGGLRCIYHGWKYAVDGTILEAPNVPEGAARLRFKQPAYPVREAGDVIWVYLGEPDRVPPFREYESMLLGASHRLTIRLDLDCNYLQLLEAAVDSSHIGVLHGDFLRIAGADAARLPEQMQRQQQFAADLAPRIEVARTEFGLQYVALRTLDVDSAVYGRVTAYVAPTTVFIPPNLNVLHYIPYDDTHTGWIVSHWSKDGPVDRERGMYAQGLDAKGVLENGRVMMSSANGFLQDRQAMRNGSWSGLHGVLAEDAAVGLAQGTILDRSKEHLVQADAACAALRRLFFDALSRLERGEDPPGLTPSSPGTIQALDFTMPAGASWAAYVPGNIEATEHNPVIGRL